MRTVDRKGKKGKSQNIGLYVEIKCQLDATEVFIADLIACSTCFGHHYAHSWGLCVRFAGCCSILQTGRI